MKKAFLVGFSPMTRIVVDIIEGEDGEFTRDKIIIAAREQMMENSIADYINGENCDLLEEDLDQPYPQDYDV